jgi:hypothetical protein
MALLYRILKIDEYRSTFMQSRKSLQKYKQPHLIMAKAVEKQLGAVLAVSRQGMRPSKELILS